MQTSNGDVVLNMHLNYNNYSRNYCQGGASLA